MNLEKIASLAGVSRSTVSRVINKHPYVSDEVRKRVEEIIAREGFQPNAAARALVKQRTEVIGVVLPEGLEGLFSSGYFPILLGGIAATISQSEYAMSLWAGRNSEETRKMYQRILGYRLMDGALLISAVDGDTLSQQLMERKMPVVVIGRVSNPGVSTVDVDNHRSARMATEHLLRIGRRRIAHIGGRMDLMSAHERHDAYKDTLEGNGIPYDPALVVWGDFSEASGYLAARKLVPQGVDAIFTANDAMAVGVIRALREAGIAVPRDVSVIGFDDLPIASSITPTITTVRQPVAELGGIATQLLMDIVDGKVTSPQRIMLPTELIIRESCGTLGNY